MPQKLKVFLLRKFYRLQNRYAWRGVTRPPLSTVDRVIGEAGTEIPLRVYTPEPGQTERIIVYFHGGGWVLGDLETHRHFCEQLSHETRSIVVAADYRLAPEHPFPAAVEDCRAAAQSVLENRPQLHAGDLPVVVAGDSAGGNLAAVIARELPGLAGQILIYPVTQHYVHEPPSYIENARGGVLTRNLMIWFWDSYLKNSIAQGRTSHPLATPLDWETPFEGPPALLLTAGLDPLRDEGALFADLLTRAGISCRFRLFENEMHGFVCSQGACSGHLEAMKEIKSWLADL
jgi:acetyl esterase